MHSKSEPSYPSGESGRAFQCCLLSQLESPWSDTFLESERFCFTSLLYVSDALSVSVAGLTHPETCVYALSDVLYAFLTTEPEAAAALTDIVSRLLLSDDLAVSFAAKQGLIRVLRPKQRRRRVFIPSPPRCSTPGAWVPPVWP